MNERKTLRFESHLTVLAQESPSLTNTRDWANAHHLKWTHIVLDGGRISSHPMITFRGSGTLADQLETANSLTIGLSSIGAKVVRIKVELELPIVESQIAIPFNPLPADQYFEHHFKLLLSPCTDLDLLSDFLIKHGGHLSRNARRQREDGMLERFVTQRIYCQDPKVSYQQFTKLLNNLLTLGLQIIEKEHEFVLYDTNLNLDSGWMNHS